MSFYWPNLLWLLLVPAGWLAWESAGRRRIAQGMQHPKILRAEIGQHDLSLVSSNHSRAHGRARPWLAVGLAFAIVALARPQWGRIEEPVFDQSREIIVAVDLSRSMLSTDVKPSRLERAKLLIQALLEKLQGERVGLVVFSGTAFLQSPMSSDYEILREFLPSLNPNFLPEGGTNYRALIDTSLDAFGNGTGADRFLIVLSDGEATDDDWQSRVDELKKRGIRVIGLGVGTAGGSMIPDGTGGFVKDDRGAVVLSKLESKTLEQLAQETGGVYRDASQWIDLASLINETVNLAQKGKFVDTRTVRLIERFQWPLALAVWCLIVSFYYEFPVRPRTRAVRLHPPRREPPPVPASARTTATAIALLLAFVAWPSGPARAAVKIAPPSSTTPPAATPPPASGSGPFSPISNPHAATPSDQPPPLAKIVGRLANADRRSALDWAEMAQETVAWGERLKSAQHPVPEGPVRDALSAVDEGSKSDAHAADWSKLREQLEALLQKPEPPQQQQKQDQQKDDQKNQSQQRQNKDQKSDSSQNQQQKPDSDQQKKSDEQKSEDQKSEQKSADQKKSESKPSDQSAFGNMQQPPKPQPPPSSEMQKVGGAPDKKAEKPPSDPTLALPLEKLDELKDQDSPAQLFQMMQAQSQASRTKPKKDW